MRLTSPSGDIWEWNDRNSNNCVSGDATAFAQVVTQVRNIEDTTLVVTGDGARKWMALAQCFAGPPITPPVKGFRFAVVNNPIWVRRWRKPPNSPVLVELLRTNVCVIPPLLTAQQKWQSHPPHGPPPSGRVSEGGNRFSTTFPWVLAFHTYLGTHHQSIATYALFFAPRIYPKSLHSCWNEIGHSNGDTGKAAQSRRPSRPVSGVFRLLSSRSLISFCILCHHFFIRGQLGDKIVWIYVSFYGPWSANFNYSGSKKV